MTICCQYLTVLKYFNDSFLWYKARIIMWQQWINSVNIKSIDRQTRTHTWNLSGISVERISLSWSVMWLLSNSLGSYISKMLFLPCLLFVCFLGRSQPSSSWSSSSSSPWSYASASKSAKSKSPPKISWASWRALWEDVKRREAIKYKYVLAHSLSY